MEQNTFNSNNIDAGSKIASFRVKQSMPNRSCHYIRHDG